MTKNEVRFVLISLVVLLLITTMYLMWG